MSEPTPPQASHGDAAVAQRGQRVAIVGRGLLASAISQAIRSEGFDAGAGSAYCDCVRAVDVTDVPDLAGLEDLIDDETGSSDYHLLLTVSDGWDGRDYERLQALCIARRISWLPVLTELGRVVIGPFYTPGVPGCVTCGELRRSLADDQFAVRQSVRERYPQLAEQSSSWMTALTARTVAAVTSDEILQGQSRSGRTRCGLVYVDLGTLAVSAHPFLPDPLCPICGEPPVDSAEGARVALQPRPKPAPTTYRVRPLGENDLERLRTTYVDEQTGLIRTAHTFASGSLAVGVAAMRSRWQDRAELSWGRTLRHQTSEIVAVLEALERYGGMAPGGRRGAVRASFAEVRDQALDPRTLGLYPAEHYELPGFHFQPFQVDRMCRWVWGYSFARQEPILVPQAYAYYRAHVTDPTDPSFAYEISNGCALGSCLEEAILYGMLEVVERDAFLMTWYAELPAARIDLSTAQDRSIPMLAEAIEAETGYRVLAFDTTMEHGIPSIWAMAVSPPGSDQPALACSAGAHFEPERAAAGALCELGPILTDLISRYPEIAVRSHHLAGDASLVATMDDHSVLYSSREAASRLEFLTGSERWLTFADIGSGNGNGDSFHNTDLTDDLADMVRRLRRHGLDVIVVDQTTPEHRASGLCCVKVIVPGMLPMTFGHQNRRVHGLPRLYEVPTLLGHRDSPLPPEDVNPHPHPFP
jgi:ribosomal protein S12 methylthiotransferase accessory factor